MKKLSRLFLILLLTLNSGCSDNTLEFKENEVSELNANFSVESKHYLIYCEEDDKVLLSYNADDKFYPASLTKLVTLDTLLNYETDLTNNYSYYTSSQYQYLEDKNASTADLSTYQSYSLYDLMYALVLPSGADAAMCIDNYFSDNGLDIIEEMNNLCLKLGLKDSNFNNTTGLHNDDLYTTLNDYLLIVKDVLKNENGKQVLSCLEYELSDGLKVESTLKSLENDEYVNVLGGKTGFTNKAGRCLCVYYEKDNKHYILLLSTAYSSSIAHFNDAYKIFNLLYN